MRIDVVDVNVDPTVERVERAGAPDWTQAWAHFAEHDLARPMRKLRVRKTTVGIRALKNTRDPKRLLEKSRRAVDIVVEKVGCDVGRRRSQCHGDFLSRSGFSAAQAAAQAL